jgi:hypothetical protein
MVKFCPKKSELTKVAIFSSQLLRSMDLQSCDQYRTAEDIPCLTQSRLLKIEGGTGLLAYFLVVVISLSDHERSASYS